MINIRVARSDELGELVAIDDDATGLYATAGIAVTLDPASPFVVDEQARWAAALARRQVWVAVDGEDTALGFAAAGTVDGEPYLDQLSVRMVAMGQGIGRALLSHVTQWAITQPGAHLWLTTYRHLAWNGPFYARCGFIEVPEDTWGPEVAHHIAQQRIHLPEPAQRVAVRKRLLCQFAGET